MKTQFLKLICLYAFCISLAQAQIQNHIFIGNDEYKLWAGADANQPWIGGVQGQDLRIIADGEEKVRVRADGAVGIGTPYVPFNYILGVNGKIICEEVRVELSTNWPDYVFEKDYELMPLEKVAQYIQKEKHLPGIPSSKELQSNGLEIGEMQRKMMEKIEELTLYMIDLKKENEALKGRLEKLEP